MRLPFHLALLAIPYITQALPTTTRRDTDIQSFQGLTHVNPSKRDIGFSSLLGLTKNLRDRSGRRGDPYTKYFHESTFHSHYDGRFAEKVLPMGIRRQNLVDLIRTYLSTMHSIGAEVVVEPSHYAMGFGC
jgi:hypothetical protein